MDTNLLEPVRPPLRPVTAEDSERCARCRHLIRVGQEAYERPGRPGYICTACALVQKKPPQPGNLGIAGRRSIFGVELN